MAIELVKETFWDKHIQAWKQLLRAIKNDRATTKTIAKDGGTVVENNYNLKIWWKAYWKIALTWGLLLLAIWYMTKQPPKRNHHRKGSKYNPY
jgi:hypothetical protein